MDTKYVIQRTNTETGEITYLSPGQVNWVSEMAHDKFRTRYGKWFWGEAETISMRLNMAEKTHYKYVPLPEGKHK